MFVILQKYDFSSKSQRKFKNALGELDVCDTAKVRFFKQITTAGSEREGGRQMFVILQKYDFSSKSQLSGCAAIFAARCLWYCKSTIFQANHNSAFAEATSLPDVCDTAKVRFFKQITTRTALINFAHGCLWYCKSTIFQANHNAAQGDNVGRHDVCDTAKVRFFKQITTAMPLPIIWQMMFVILQKYDFSSKSQQVNVMSWTSPRCLWYCKSTIFQANHNKYSYYLCIVIDVCDTAKVRFFKQITTWALNTSSVRRCLWYCKSTIFQANHNDK